MGFFNKIERFHDILEWPVKATLWDMWVHFGFYKRSDGVVEVWHTGESFYGPWPIRLLFHLHAKYVIWATEKHVNSATFGDSEKLEEQEHQRCNIPVFAFGEFVHHLTDDLETLISRKQANDECTADLEKSLTNLRKATVTIKSANQTLLLRRRTTHPWTKAIQKSHESDEQRAVDREQARVRKQNLMKIHHFVLF